MDGIFFYAIKGKQHGPVSWDELRQLAVCDNLNRTDRVWGQGMKEWQPAASIPNLFEDLPPDMEVGIEPRPITPSGKQASASAQTAEPASVAAPAQQNEIFRSKATRNILIVLGMVACLIVLFPPIQTYQAPELVGGRSPNPNYEGDVGEPGLVIPGGFRDRRFTFLLTVSEGDKIVVPQLLGELVGLALIGLVIVVATSNKSAR